MPSPPLRLTRQELYEKVWTTPMQRLAREFGLSDVGLAKLCRRHRIPVPGRGYWARRAAGQEPGRIPLPPVDDIRLETIEIHPREHRVGRAAPAEENHPVPIIRVADDRPISHPLARRIERSISRAKQDRGLLLPRESRVVPLHVSSAALPRALRILDALLFALEEAGYALQWPKPYNTPLKVVVQEEALAFSISEIVRARPHALTPQEAARPWMAPRRYYEPTGRLKLSIDCGNNLGVRRAWSDGKKRRLEERLGHFLLALPLVADALKREREERAERERRWAEQRQREEEARRRQEEYNRKAKVIEKFAHSWRESRLLQDFSAALNATAESPSMPGEQRQEIRAMVDFALRHADHLDPLTDPKWMTANFRDPPWPYGF